MKFTCQFCDYFTVRKCNYVRHLQSIKHLAMSNQKNQKTSTESITQSIIEPQKIIMITKKPSFSEQKRANCDLSHDNDLQKKPKNEHSLQQKQKKTKKNQKTSTESITQIIIEPKNEHSLQQNTTKSIKQIYNCNLCNYETNRKSNMERHNVNCRKDINNVNSKKQMYMCKFCNNVYKSYSGLYRHKKKCNNKHNNILLDISKKMDLYKATIDQQSQKIKLLENNRTITNNITYNNNNKTINIENYLNLECKDAMNLNDFISSLTLTLQDVLTMGKSGFANSFYTLVTQRIKQMDEKKRPIHCTNMKRSLLYVKHKDEWQRDEDHKLITSNIYKLRDMELNILYEHLNNILPTGYKESDREVIERTNSLSEIQKLGNEKKRNKIIRQISKELYLHI